VPKSVPAEFGMASVICNHFSQHGTRPVRTVDGLSVIEAPIGVDLADAEDVYPFTGNSQKAKRVAGHSSLGENTPLSVEPSKQFTLTASGKTTISSRIRSCRADREHDIIGSESSSNYLTNLCISLKNTLKRYLIWCGNDQPDI
jgi:hypothetical protein